MKVIIKPRAQRSIEAIASYIVEKGYPETAFKYVSRLEAFIMNLPNFPDKFEISRHKAFKKRVFHQVPFEKNQVILYKVVDDVLYVHNIVHAKRLR